MRKLCIAVVVATVLCGCAATGTEPGGEAAGVGGSGPAELPDGTPILQVKITDQTSDGRVMLMRGKLVNPHAQPVEGVRMLLALAAPAGDGGRRITDVQRKEMGSTIPAGGSTMFRWDVESQSLAGPGRILLVAFPKKLGDHEVPPPPEWTGEKPIE